MEQGRALVSSGGGASLFTVFEFASKVVTANFELLDIFQ